MYLRDLRLGNDDVRRLGLVVNIGLVGRVYPARRRWLTTHFIAPEADTKRPNDVVSIPLSLWNQFDDTFEHADQAILDELATWVGLTPQDFSQALKLRIDCLEELSEGTGADSREMFDAINELREHSQKP